MAVEFTEYSGINAERIVTLRGTAHTASAYAASAGFGSTAAVTVTAGTTDMGGEFTVTCGGTGQGASPTVTLTFVDGAFPTGATAKATCTRSNTTQPTVPFNITTANTTTLVFTFQGTASGTEVYKCRWRI